jgi:hypothetical protein
MRSGLANCRKKPQAKNADSAVIAENAANELIAVREVFLILWPYPSCVRSSVFGIRRSAQSVHDRFANTDLRHWFNIDSLQP